jgi:signal transduction histidine kinase
VRRRLTLAILAVATAAVVLFALPLALVLRDGYRDQELLRLQRDTVAAARLIDLGTSAGDPVELPRGSDRLAVYDGRGRRVAGAAAAGPTRADTVVRDAILRRRPAIRAGDGALLVAVPLLSGERVTGAVRAERSDAVVGRRTRNSWLALTAAAAGVLLFARPLERVALAAGRLGDGDFSVRAPHGNIREVDAVADALDLTARRLDDLVTRERAFSADASHQLRTPLAALRLELETLQLQPGHPEELARAVRQIDRLEQTIDTLLAAGRDTVRTGAGCNLVTALGDAEGRWRGRLAAEGRRLALQLPPGTVHARVGPGVVNEILDVLLDNATRHGAGTVTVAVATVDAQWTRVEVSDEGPGFAVPAETAFARRAGPAGAHGIGLALARSLAHAEGGRLSITREGPAPIVTLLLGAATERGPGAAHLP